MVVGGGVRLHYTISLLSFLRTINPDQININLFSFIYY
jgi:hypothetical protein